MKLRALAALALAATLSSCQEESATSPDSGNARGCIALAFSPRALAQLGSTADSLHLGLIGDRDTIRAIARLGDTVRFDGLRTGVWSVSAEVFANDSGIRKVEWVGSASALVEAGGTARVALLLRKPTGSLIVEIGFEDGAIDTPTVIVSPDSTDTIPVVVVPPSDSPAPPVGTLPAIDPKDSTRWSQDGRHYVATARFDTSSSWIGGSVRLLGAHASSMGLVARVAIRGGANAVAGILAPVQDVCGSGDVDTTCLPYRVRLVGRRALSGSASDSSIRVADVLIDMGTRTDRAVVLEDDYGTSIVAEEPAIGSRCEHLHDGGLAICYDVAGFQGSFLDPFDRL